MAKMGETPTLGHFFITFSYFAQVQSLALQYCNTHFYTSYINRASLHDNFDTLVESIQLLLDIL